MSTLTMYDAIPEEIPNIPANPQAVGGYVDGRYVWSSADWARFPHAHHLTIAAFATGRARCLDIEAGDAQPEEAPGWYHSRADRTHGKPWLYTSASNVAAVIGTMTRAGISRSSYFIFSAHYGAGEHICGPRTCGFPQADGTQWADTVSRRSCDVSLLSEAMFTSPAPPPAKGIVRAGVTLDLAKGHWHVEGLPGTDVRWAPDDRWASVELQINERTGHWRWRALAFDAPPLGAGK